MGKFIPNGKYNYGIGTIFHRYKIHDAINSGLIKCKITGYIWLSPDVGGVYSCEADDAVENMDCNWNRTYSKWTSISDKELYRASQDGTMICYPDSE